MVPRTLCTISLVLLCLSAHTLAKDIPPAPQKIRLARPDICSVAPLGATAAVDTILVLGPTGSGAPYLGDFEAGWNGWTSEDLTQNTDLHWHVSDYNQAVPGNLAAWCGSLDFPACADSPDVVGGYGNSWYDLLTLSLVVADPGLPATVQVTATLQTDCEPAYDFAHLTAHLGLDSNMTDLASWDGKGTVAVDESFVVEPTELVDDTKVMLSFRFTSDGGWSDADCSYAGAGACQVDDITVTVSQSGYPDLVSATDFQDGTLGGWVGRPRPGVGDFAQLWRGLRDIDPCRINLSQQVGFIDDGVVVPGTGGTDCITWCYGPGGYIVNNTGGLIGPSAHLKNAVVSPPMAWPDANMAGAVVAYDIYSHNEYLAVGGSVFELFDVRSADTDGSAGFGVHVLADQPWVNNNTFFDQDPGYFRVSHVVGALLEPGRDVVQVRLGAWDLAWAWGLIGPDGTPAPYFDNVSFKAYTVSGPSLRMATDHLAQDGFPENDMLDFANLGAMNVRFDMAANIAPAVDLRNDPGDSLVIDIIPQREGATVAVPPEMHYIIDPNPVFDPYRTTAINGTVQGLAGETMRWSFDLPDTGTLFPGDVLHYYFRAGDDLGGVVQYNTLPADLGGFGDFSDPLAYDTQFVVRALPSIRPDGLGGHDAPPILLWNDNGAHGGEDEWYAALRAIGQLPGLDFDVYNTRNPIGELGNGLGGRTAGASLALYDIMLYSAGDQPWGTLSIGSFDADPGDDVGTLRNWLDSGNRNLFLTGDSVVADLVTSGEASGPAFVNDVLGVIYSSAILRDLIDGQAYPVVSAIPGNPVFGTAIQWVAYGGCPGLNAFDAVTAGSGAERLAEFTAAGGATGSYSYSAATLNTYGANNRIISLTYDFESVRTLVQDKAPAPMPVRAALLWDVLNHFGYGEQGDVSGVPVIADFKVTAFPNPFNPSTRLEYAIRSAGHLKLRIYNLRGQLVRTLIDGQVQNSGHVMWDGTDNSGASVASGVYFSEAEMAGEVRVSKMALIK